MSSEALPRIPWARVLTEGAVIVVSILLAFGIDAWWEDRGDSEEAREILLGLREEFTWYEDRLNFRAARHVRIVDEISKVLAASYDGYAWSGVEEMDSAFQRVISVGTWDPGSGTRDALIASGRLERLQDPNLRAALSSWGSVVDEVRDGEFEMRTFVRESIVPLAADLGAPMGRNPFSVSPAAQMPPEQARRSYQALFSDGEFRSLVEFRLRWELSSGGEYQTALAAAKNILRLVSESLRSP